VPVGPQSRFGGGIPTDHHSFDAEYGNSRRSNEHDYQVRHQWHSWVCLRILAQRQIRRARFLRPIDQPKAELRRNQFGYAVEAFLENKLFWFTDYQGTREVRGASTGSVTVPTAAQRSGTFTPADFADSSGNPLLVNSQPCPGGATCGLNWADTLTQRLAATTGQTVVDGEPYSTPTCANTTQCVFPTDPSHERWRYRPPPFPCRQPNTTLIPMGDAMAISPTPAKGTR